MTNPSDYCPRHRHADKVGPAPWRATGGLRAVGPGFGFRSIALLAVLAVVAIGAWIPFYLSKSNSDELRTKADVAAGAEESEAASTSTPQAAGTQTSGVSTPTTAAQRRAAAARQAAAARSSRAATPLKSPPPATAAAGSSDLDAATENAKVVALVNVERVKVGCGPVHSDARLDAASVAHSQDMILRGYFDHTSPDGVSPWDRARSAGYALPTGENIAIGQPDAAAVMAAWMNSVGHRANILNCLSKAIGMGLAHDTDGTPYWTQMFGAI
jgi:uncharacterized protein YkwD